MNSLFKALAFLLLAGMILAMPAQAASIYWVGPNTGGNYNDTANWSSGSLPTPADYAYVGYGDNVMVTSDNDVTPGRVYLGRPITYNGTGYMTISAGDFDFLDYFYAGVYNSGGLTMTGGSLNRVNWYNDGYSPAIYGLSVGHFSGEYYGSPVGYVNMSNDASINIWNTGTWIGYGRSSTTDSHGIGSLTMADNSRFKITPSPRQFIVGGNGSQGTLIMTDNARIDVVQGGSNWFIVGASAGVGTMEMSGNTVVSSRSGEVAVGTDSNAVGSLLMTGNSYLYASNYLTAGNFSGKLGVITLMDNARIDHRVCNWRTSGGDFIIGSQGAYGIVNLQNGYIHNDQEIYLGNGATTSSAILNLNGGIAEATAVVTGNAGTLAMVNFNGGTLRAMANNSNFLNNDAFSNLQLNVYSGGAKIDTQSYTINITQPLIAPAGEGFVSIPVTNGGSGYTTAPAVKITTTSGYGVGATAIAQINGSGQVTNIVITNPGTGYTSYDTFNIELFSSNGSGATVGTPTLTSGGQASGGLTKYGVGILRLSAANTYTGPTVVEEGTLRILGPGGTLASSGITVKNGATLGGDALAFALPAVTVQSGGTIAPGNGAYGTLKLSTLSIQDKARFIFKNDAVSATGSDLLTLDSAPVVASGKGIVDFVTNTTYPATFLAPTDIMNWTWASGETSPALMPAVDSIGTSTYGLTYTAGDAFTPSKVQATFATITNEWGNGLGGAYGNVANWSNSGPPAYVPGVDQQALFGSLGGTIPGSVVDLQASVNVGSVIFDNLTAPYTLSDVGGAGSTLTLSSTIASEAQITLVSGSHTINVPVVLGQNTRVNVYDAGGASGFALTMNGVVSGAGGLGLFQGGKLVLANTANTYTGPTVMFGGTLEVASLANGGASSSIGASSSAPSNLILNGAFKYVGTTDVVTDRGFTNAGTVDFDTGAQNLTFSGQIATTANGLFNKYGSGTLKFTNSGVNTFNGSDLRVIQGTVIFDGGAGSEFNLNSDTSAQSAWWVPGDERTLAGDAPVLEFRSGSFDVVGRTYIGKGVMSGAVSTLKMTGDSKLRTGLISLGWSSGASDPLLLNTKPVLEMHDNAFISCSSDVWIGDNNGADATLIMDGNARIETATTFRTAANGDMASGFITKANMRMSGNSSLTINAGHLYFGVRGNSVVTLEGNARVEVTPSFRYAQASPPNSNDYTIYNTVVGYGNTSGTDMAGTSRLYIKDNAYLQTAQLYVGLYGYSSGAVFQSGGTVFSVNGRSSPSYASGTMELGWIIGGYAGLGYQTTTSNTTYGYYGLSGGVADGNLGQIYVGLAGTGVVDISGGTMQTTQRLWMGLLSTGYGVLNISGGELKTKLPDGYGTSSTGSSVIGGHQLASSVGGTGIMNLSGTGVFDEPYRLYVGYSNGTASSGGVGIVNLGAVLGGGTGGSGGGTLLTVRLQRPNATLTTTAGTVNFHGGLLKAKGANGSFNIGTTNFVWNEGANIDSNGFDITATSQFLAPTGLGVLSIDPPTNPGSGYIAPPAVKISGGSAALGQGATANAIVDLVVGSPTYGQVTGFVITNPGVGYQPGDVLTVELKGGISNIYGESTAASGFTVNFNSGNASGGLTKTGLGTLTLAPVLPGTTTSTSNTYTGDTNVMAGVLRANDGVGLPAASFLNLNGGMLENASEATLSRTVGTSGAGKIKINNGGFAAGSGAFTVSLVPSGAGTDLEWGTDLTGILRLNSPSATNVVTLTNGIRLNGDRTIQVDDNTGSTADWAVISGNIVDGSTPSSLIKTGAGTLILTGTNTYSGAACTVVSGGALQADDGAGLPNASFLNLDGGVLQSNGNVLFTRGLATSGAGKFQMTANGGGFSANGGTMNVRIGGGTAAVNWGTTVGSELVGTLMLGSVTATNVTTFENAINLGAADRTIQVIDNTASTTDKAVISGVISGSGVGIIKTGAGILALTGANNYTGTTKLSEGTLDFSGAPSMPGGNYVVEAGTLDIGALTPTVGSVQVLSGTIAGTGSMTGTNYDIQGGTINVVLAGGPTVGLVKTTAATAILAANNTYGGATTVTEGTLQLGAGGTAGSVASSAISVAAAGTLAINRSDAVAVNNVSGAGSLSQLGAGTTTLTNTSVAGNLSVAAGTLDYSSATNTLPAGSYTVSGAATVLNLGALSQTIATMQLTGDAVINGSGTLTVNGNQFDLQAGTVNAKLAGSGVMEKASTGTVILNGANSYTGQTSIYAGALQADIGVGLPSGSFLRLSGGVLQSNGAASFTRPMGLSGSTVQMINGGFAAGGGPLTVNLGGSGATVAFGQILGTNITGLLKFGSTSAQNVVTFQNGLDIAGATRTIQVDDNTAVGTDYAVISGIISNSNTLTTDVGITKTGAGTLALTGANTFQGPLTITTGAVRAVDTVGLPTNSKLSLNGGVLESVGNDTFTRSVGSSGSFVEWTANGGGFSAGGGTMTVNIQTYGSPLEWGTTVGSGIVGTLKFGSVTAGNVVTFANNINLNANRTIQVDDNVSTDADYAVMSGVIANNLSGTTARSVTKTGAGKLVFTGTNTYTGSTTISAGTLQLGNGGTTGIVAGNIAINGTSALIVNRSNDFTYAGVISGAATASFTKTGAGKMTLSGNNTFPGPTIITGGTLALATTGQLTSSSSIANDATFLVVDGAHTVKAISGTGTTWVANAASLTAPSIVQNTLTIGGVAAAAAVPEPGTFALLLLAGIALAGAYLRRK